MRAHLLLTGGFAATFVFLARCEGEGEARADGATINPGPMLTAVGGHSPAVAFGGELSFMYYAEKSKIQNQLGLGAFVQAQRYDGNHGRYALGVQAGNILGVELGWAYRESSPDHSFAMGPHLALFASMGFLVAFVRTTVPVVHGDAPSHGFELAAGLAFKFPIPIGDIDVVGNLPSGRPLRARDGAALVASIERGLGWSEGGATDDALDAATKRELARAWLEDARMEHASVAAFASLSLDLLAAGAPPHLVAGAHHAALQEVQHARACFALASAYAGEALTAGPLALGDHASRIARGDLCRMGVEAFVDGCVGEAAAAACATRALEGVRDEAARAVLTTIARDEASHAELAWDVLAWCVAQGGEDARGDVERAVADLATAVRANAPPAGVDERVLAAHGRIAPAEVQHAYASARAVAIARVAGVLARSDQPPSPGASRLILPIDPDRKS